MRTMAENWSRFAFYRENSCVCEATLSNNPSDASFSFISNMLTLQAVESKAFAMPPDSLLCRIGKITSAENVSSALPAEQDFYFEA